MPSLDKQNRYLPTTHGFTLSCKAHLRSRLFRGYFSFFDISEVVNKKLILFLEVKILFKIGNIYRDYIVGYLSKYFGICINPIE